MSFKLVYIRNIAVSVCLNVTTVHNHNDTKLT